MEIKEENLKSILGEQREEYQRYLGVLTGSFESQVKLVAESITGTEKQLIAIKEMVAKNTEDIEEMKTELHLIRGDLKEKVGRDEFRLLENRVAVLEKSTKRS